MAVRVSYNPGGAGSNDVRKEEVMGYIKRSRAQVINGDRTRVSPLELSMAAFLITLERCNTLVPVNLRFSKVKQYREIKSWCRQSSMRMLDDCRWWW